eukprot:GHVT01080235.1.p1 GENE.GHVT01080235.1~~GHVT01080235.1.p1  ORF type:complete len:425 (-),score=112.32 GHVT01080235.1:1158-2432(-)
MGPCSPPAGAPPSGPGEAAESSAAALPRAPERACAPRGTPQVDLELRAQPLQEAPVRDGSRNSAVAQGVPRQHALKHLPAPEGQNSPKSEAAPAGSCSSRSLATGPDPLGQEPFLQGSKEDEQSKRPMAQATVCKEQEPKRRKQNEDSGHSLSQFSSQQGLENLRPKTSYNSSYSTAEADHHNDSFCNRGGSDSAPNAEATSIARLPSSPTVSSSSRSSSSCSSSDCSSSLPSASSSSSCSSPHAGSTSGPSCESSSPSSEPSTSSSFCSSASCGPSCPPCDSSSASPSPGPPTPAPPAVTWSVRAMQGRRPKQEDRHVLVDDFAELIQDPADHLGINRMPHKPRRLCALFDGHCGSLASSFCATHLPATIASFLARTSPKMTPWQRNAPLSDEAVHKRVAAAFAKTDKDFLKKYRCLRRSNAH